MRLGLRAIKEVGIRPGEKLHEQMVGAEDAPFTFEYDGYYKILPNMFDWSSDQRRIQNGTKVPSDFTYQSDANSDWMTVEQLRSWIDINRNKIGEF